MCEQTMQLSLFAPPPAPPRLAREPAMLSLGSPIDPDTGLHAAIAAYNVHLAIRKDLADASRYAMGRDLQVAGQILGMSRAVGSLTRADLEHLVAHLQATSSPATVARRGATVNGFLRWLSRQGALPGDPPRVPVSQPDPPLPTVLSRDQIARLLEFTAGMKDPRPAFLVRLVLTTGMKKHEVVPLRVQHLALDADPPLCRRAGETAQEAQHPGTGCAASLLRGIRRAVQPHRAGLPRQCPQARLHPGGPGRGAEDAGQLHGIALDGGAARSASRDGSGATAPQAGPVQDGLARDIGTAPAAGCVGEQVTRQARLL